MDEKQITPLMKQYYAIKSQYADALVLFQVGDFYELFFEDAKTAARTLAITLTARGKNNGEPIPLCGVPVHAVDYYLGKLVKAGFKIAICNQLEEAVPGKIVERGVTQVITPGTITDQKLLDPKASSYLLFVFSADDHNCFLFVEFLTAQLFVTFIPINDEKLMETELMRFFPDEIVMQRDGHEKLKRLFEKFNFYISYVDQIDALDSKEWFLQFAQQTQEYIAHYPSLKKVLLCMYCYLKSTHHYALSQFKTIQWYAANDFLMLDATAQQNLELWRNNYDGTTSHTLFDVLDGAVTSMGSRLIKKWIAQPLTNKQQILQRQDFIELLIKSISLINSLIELLKAVGDIERIVGRIALKKGTLNDYLALKCTLQQLPTLKKILNSYCSLDIVKSMLVCCESFDSLFQLLDASLNDDASKDFLICSGFDQSLDDVRKLVDKSNELILSLERSEQEKTGIASLKIRYNQVHGYYIEVTKPNLHLVPDYYIRHQTLVGKERYTTPELKQLEIDILHAHNQIEEFESALFERIKQEVHGHISALRRMAQALAHLDGLLGLARVAYEHHYIRPQFHETNDIIIKQGRHPVVERSKDNAYIANDTHLINEQFFWIITGPNMGGKSTYMRQVALLCLMAQCGSYIPAESAQLPILDRIFTRIGASDQVAYGKSTFLVEMEETSSICNDATERSLIILDEIGRGTSTYDGLAIAQAVAEYLHSSIKARCLFATHYHELTELARSLPGVANYHAASKKTEQGILLLYSIVPGIAQGSFGIEVARMAQLPPEIIMRAMYLLSHFSKNDQTNPNFQNSDLMHLLQTIEVLQKQLAHKDALLKEFQALEYDHLSPKQAFDVLWSFKEKLTRPVE